MITRLGWSLIWLISCRITTAQQGNCQFVMPVDANIKYTPITSYRIDTALIKVKVDPNTTDDVVYSWKHGECYQCPMFECKLPEFDNSCDHRLQTKWSNVLKVEIRNSSEVEIGNSSEVITGSTCEINRRFRDRGEYTLLISVQSGGGGPTTITCDISLNNDPPNPDLPMLYAFLIFAGLAAIWVLLVHLYRKGRFNRLLNLFGIEEPAIGSATVAPETNQAMEMNEEKDSDAGVESNRPPPANYPVKSSLPIDAPGGVVTVGNGSQPANKKKQRLRSLDTFRGMSLVVMIFVNLGSAGYYYMEHAVWNGLTVGDLVFPWFVFIMGTSMTYSFRSMFKGEPSTKMIIWKIVWRSVKLFAIGIFLNTKWGNDMEMVRITGILQRFSATYMVVALVCFPLARKNLNRAKHLLGDVIFYWPEWIIMLAILALYLALTFALPVPDCPTGYIGAGGLAEGAAFRNCTGGAARHIDDVILGYNHILRGWSTYGVAYYTNSQYPLDPEGILGTLTSIFLCFLGLQAGKIISMHKTPMQILIRWAIWAVITGGIALLLCQASKDGGWIPINKNLWSVSFILAMASTAYITLGVMFILIDLFEVWNGAPFIYPGMNSIVIYFCSSSFTTNFPVSWQMPDGNLHWQLMIVTSWSVCFWIIVSYVLFRKKIFIAL